MLLQATRYSSQREAWDWLNYRVITFCTPIGECFQSKAEILPALRTLLSLILRRQDSSFLETVGWFIMCSLLISSIPYTPEKVQTDCPWAWGTVREKSLLHSCNNKTPRSFSLLDFPYEVYSLALAFLTVWSFSWFTSILIDLELISIWRFYFSSCLKKSDRVLIREFAPLTQDHIFPRMCCLFSHAYSWKT